MSKIKGFIALILIVAALSKAADANEFNRNLLYEKYCAGNISEFEKELDSATKKDPNDIRDRFLYVLSKKGQQQEALNLVNRGSDISKLSEVDRVVFASVMLLSKSKDFGKVSNLLNFKSGDKETEGRRIQMSAYFDLIQNRPELAMKKMADAFAQLPYKDSTLLFDLFSLGSRDKNAELFLLKYFSIVDDFSDMDPYRYAISAIKEVVTTRDYQKVRDFNSKAYRLCKYDQNIALSYGFDLYSAGEISNAETIFLDIIRQNLFYSSYVDFYLAEIYKETKQDEKFEIFLAKAKGSIDYLIPEFKRRVLSLDSDIQNNEPSISWSIVSAAFFALLAAAFVIHKILKKLLSKLDIKERQLIYKILLFFIPLLIAWYIPYLKAAYVKYDRSKKQTAIENRICKEVGGQECQKQDK